MFRPPVSLLMIPVWRACMVVALMTVPSRADDPDSAVAPKKLIEWGWDEPDARFLREHIDEMERYPFDGLVFHVNSSQGGNFVWEMWGGRRFERDEFADAVTDLRATNFNRFTEQFLRVNVTPGTVDWFDDAAWQGVLHNSGVAAQVVRDGRCRGFMFDVEQYQHELFNFERQPPGRTWDECRAMVRQRGGEWMREVNRHCPEVTILLTFGYSLAQPKVERDSSRSTEGADASNKERNEFRSTLRARTRYGLLADFLDGMLDACSETTVLVDAWEQSYPYKQPEQFAEAYETIRKRALDWTAAPEQYRQHVRAGFGLWLDYDWRHKGWDVADLSKNFFAPDEFEAALRAALDRSDQYVWIYTEQPRWWTNEKLPPAYVEAVQRARGK